MKKFTLLILAVLCLATYAADNAKADVPIRARTGATVFYDGVSVTVGSRPRYRRHHYYRPYYYQRYHRRHYYRHHHRHYYNH
jgi:hypothetical protein